MRPPEDEARQEPPHRRILAWSGVAAAGALLLAVPAARYRIDRVSCANWPAPGAAITEQLAFVAAIALLTAAWLALWRHPPRRLGQVLLLAAGVHAAALVPLPFLSCDPLYYAALGHAAAHPYTPIGQVLGDHHPLLQALPEDWRQGTSAYFPGFHAIAWLVAQLAGDDVLLHLRLFQALGGLALLAAAFVVGRAAGEPRAAVMVAFCPLALLEGTTGAHNDAFIALAVALYVLLWRRGRGGLALLALLGGLSIKLTGVVPLAYAALAALGARAGRRLDTPARRRLALAVTAAAGATLLVVLLPWLRNLTHVIGSPADATDQCTMRQVECGVRFGLRWLFSAHQAAFVVGLLFRGLSLLLLVWAALRGAAPERRLPTLALFVGLYFLLVAGWAQSWYYLPLVALLPFAAPAHRRLLAAILVTQALWYPSHLLFGCDEQPPLPPWVEGTAGGVQLLVANLPPAIFAWLDRRRR